jgi:hypothetical protein
MRALCLAAALLLPGLGAAAERYTVALLPASGSNVAEGTLAAAGDVLRAHLESTGRFVVVRAERRSTSAEPAAAEAAEAARAAGASLAVTLHVSRLADRALARLAAYGPDGALVHADQLPALGADDLDPVLKRLSEGLARGRRGSELAQIDSVTRAEEAPLAKRTAFQAFGLRVGALFPVVRPDEDQTGGPGGAGLVWHYDARSWLAEVALEGYLSNLNPDRYDPERALTFGVGVFLPLSKGDVAPYLGAGLHYALMRIDGETGNGLQPRAAAGLLLGRLSNVAVRVEVGAFWNLFATGGAAGDEVNGRGALVSLTFVSAPPTGR